MKQSVPWAGRVGAGALIVFIVAYMLAPLVVIAGASINDTRFLSFPPTGFSFEWYADAMTSRTYVEAFKLSLAVGITAAVIASALGTSAALALSRFAIPGRSVIQGFLMSPLTIPTIILAIGSLAVVSTVAGAPSVPVLILTHSVIAIPYVIRTVTGVMARANRFTEEAARTLGAGIWSRYWFVVLPAARPGIAAGAFFAFNISFDDAVIALFLRTPQIETLPIAIYGQLEFSTSPTVAAVSTLMVLLTVVLMIVLERTIGLGRMFI